MSRHLFDIDPMLALIWFMPQSTAAGSDRTQQPASRAKCACYYQALDDCDDADADRDNDVNYTNICKVCTETESDALLVTR